MQTFCDFGDDLICRQCGFRAKFARVRRHCVTPPPQPMAQRLTRYAASLARWLAAGRPVRDEAEVRRILADCCEPCAKFRDGVCLACGCRVNASRRGWQNKIAMATEACPLRPPKWDARCDGGQSPLRIALVTPVLLAGGVESWHISLARELQKRKDVQVACVGHLGSAAAWHDETTRELARYAPIVSALPSEHAQQLATSWEVLAVCAASADVIVVWSLQPTEMQFLRAQCGVKPIVGVSHGGGDWWMQAAAPYVDHWVAVNDAAKTPIPSTEATVIDNGVDVERCRATLSRESVRDAAGIPRNARLIVSIGRLSLEKRLRLLAGALDRLPIDCWLWLVGDGRDADQYRAAAGSAVDRLVISPSRRDVGNVLGAADCFAFASQSEGYGLAPVESLAAGVPLVATPVGVLPSLGDCAEWLPIDPTLGQVADGILSVLPRVAGDGTTRPLEVLQRSYDYRHIVLGEHSAESMARRWAAYLAKIAATRGSNIQR